MHAWKTTLLKLEYSAWDSAGIGLRSMLNIAGRVQLICFVNYYFNYRTIIKITRWLKGHVLSFLYAPIMQVYIIKCVSAYLLMFKVQRHICLFVITNVIVEWYWYSVLIVATYNTLENWHKIINVVLMRFLFVSSLQVLQYIYIYIYIYDM